MNIKKILKTKVTELDLNDFPQASGLHGNTCKICTSEHRAVFDYLLTKGVSQRKVAQYYTFSELGSISNQAVFNHKIKHTLLNDSKSKQITPHVTENKRVAALDQLRRMDLKDRLNEIEVAAFADVVSGEKVPTIREGLAAAQLRKDLDAAEQKGAFLKEFFAAADKNPIKDGKVKRKIKVTPVEGVEFSQEVSQ